MVDKNEKPKLTNQGKHVPKDAQVIMSMMRDMNISEYEPRVINQFLEFTYRYATSVLDDARIFANHGKKKLIDLDDVRLAVQCQVDKSFTTPPPRQVLLEVAKSKNITPLPPIKPHCGLRLPPDRYCLSACNFRLKPTIKKMPSKTMGGSSKQNQKSAGQQNVIVKRQTIVTVPKTQSVQAVPKPVFKFNSGNKVVTKPAIKISQGTTGGHLSQVKMEVDIDSIATKRKREDSDYDAV